MILSAPPCFLKKRSKAVSASSPAAPPASASPSPASSRASAPRWYIASRKEENLASAVEQIRSESHGDAAHYHVLDVRDADAVEAMAARVESTHGRIDFLVNNAAGNFIVPSDQLTANGWNSVIGIVLNGTFYCSSAVGKRMIENETAA